MDPTGATTRLGGVAGWLDDRTGVAKPLGPLMRKVFPDHWSFMLGEVALYSLLMLLITGTFLTVWFVPSSARVVYDGSYLPLRGLTMSEAYRSTVDISFEVRGGLLVRQIHHWAALLFTVAITVHMMRVFFTGAFRKPRELNWLIGTTLSLLALIEGFAGYSLPDDLLSGTGLRIANGMILSVPVIGSWLAFALFGGSYPSEAIIPRLFTVHVLLLPAIIVGLALVHVLIVVVQKHTQFPGPGRTEHNVVGFPLMPVYAAKAGGFFFIVFGATALMAALVTINPIWMFGPYDPVAASAGSQPDWFMGFAEGALRLMLPWEFHDFGHTLSLNVLLPGVLLMPTMYGAAGAYPFLERWVTGAGAREHHLLDRPRDAPTRTAIGVGALTFYVALLLAGGNDIIAVQLHLSIETITHTLRVVVLVGPLVTAWVARRICLSLQRRDRESVLHGRETGRLVRTSGGGFFEVHEDLTPDERWPLLAPKGPPTPYAAESAALSEPKGPEEQEEPEEATSDTGRRSRLRRTLGRLYFSDILVPATPARVLDAHHATESDEDSLRDVHVGGPTRSRD